MSRRPLPVSRPFLPAHGILKALLDTPLTRQELGAEPAKALEEEPRPPLSAFLGPTLWEKTYDGDSFQLEILDLEEFLEENGLSYSGPAHLPPQAPPLRPPAPPTLPSVTDLSHASSSDATGVSDSRITESPTDPDSVQVRVGFDPDPTDLALSSVPGQVTFDPRRCKFSLEELRPQPMMKKARKVFTPDDMKDDKYWARRRKNNVSAKRSRDARRLKENQVLVRAAHLERENTALRQEVTRLRRELGRNNNILLKYQARHGAL